MKTKSEKVEIRKIDTTLYDAVDAANVVMLLVTPDNETHIYSGVPEARLREILQMACDLVDVNHTEEGDCNV